MPPALLSGNRSESLGVYRLSLTLATRAPEFLEGPVALALGPPMELSTKLKTSAKSRPMIAPAETSER